MKNHLIPIILDKQRPIFLFRDDFLTAEAAPLTSPRTTEPGGELAVIVDTDNDALDIISGSLVFDNFNSQWADPGYWSNSSFARAAGLCFYYQISDVGNGTTGRFGIDSDKASFSLEGFGISTLVVRGLLAGGATTPEIGSLTAPSNYFLVLRSAGNFIIKDNILLWVENSLTTDPVFLSITTFSKNYGLGSTRVSQLPAPWNTDDGIATSTIDGSLAAGNTFAHEADTILEFIATTVPSVGQIEYEFRRQDADNKMRVTIDSAGAIDLDKEVATVVTQLDTDAGPVTDGERIVIIADGTDITVFVDNALALTTAGGVFTSETAGELESLGTGGAVDDHKAFPRTITGANGAVDALNEVVKG